VSGNLPEKKYSTLNFSLTFFNSFNVEYFLIGKIFFHSTDNSPGSFGSIGNTFMYESGSLLVLMLK